MTLKYYRFFFSNFQSKYYRIKLFCSRCVDDVIKAVFQFVTLLKKSSTLMVSSPSASSDDAPPLESFFREIQHLSMSQFQTKDQEKVQDYASGVANALHAYAPRDVLSAEYVFTSWRPDLVDRVLAYLSPDNIRVTVLSKRCKIFATQVKN